MNNNVKTILGIHPGQTRICVFAIVAQTTVYHKNSFHVAPHSRCFCEASVLIHAKLEVPFLRKAVYPLELLICIHGTEKRPSSVLGRIQAPNPPWSIQLNNVAVGRFSQLGIHILQGIQIVLLIHLLPVVGGLHLLSTRRFLSGGLGFLDLTCVFPGLLRLKKMGSPMFSKGSPMFSKKKNSPVAEGASSDVTLYKL